MPQDKDDKSIREDDPRLGRADDSSGDEDDSLASAFMPLTEHLNELRSRIIRSLVVVVVIFLLCWGFRESLMAMATLPHSRAMQSLGISDDLTMIRYQEGFYAHVLISLIAAILIAAPYLIYQVWAFVSSGLYAKERRYIRRLIPMFILLFSAGALFGYFFALPVGLGFFVRMSGRGVRPLITLSNYLSTFLWLTLVFGLAFELPAAVYAVCKIGLISGENLRKGRKYAILGMFIGAALITPPDPFTMAALALPLIVLYEVGIFLGEPNRENLRNAAFAMLIALAIPGAAYGRSFIRSSRAARVTEGRIIVERRSGHVEIGEGGRIPAGTQFSAPDDIIVFFEIGGNATVKLDGGSRISIGGIDAISVLSGRLYAAVRRDSPLFISTEQVQLTLRSGEAAVEVVGETTIVAALKGDLQFYSTGREGVIAAGRMREFVPEDSEADPERILQWLRSGQ